MHFLLNQPCNYYEYLKQLKFNTSSNPVPYKFNPENVPVTFKYSSHHKWINTTGTSLVQVLL